MKKVKKVNVLGTEYAIKFVKISKCDELRNNNWCGCCNGVIHRILIGDVTEKEYFGEMTEEEQEEQTRRTLRHEIVHAFLNESGLNYDAHTYNESWAKNEEMVDWIALQFPKLMKAFEEADCL